MYKLILMLPKAGKNYYKEGDIAMPVQTMNTAVEEYNQLIDNCTRMYPAAREFFKVEPTKWVRKTLHILENTLQTSKYTDEIESYLSTISFNQFLDVLESTSLVILNIDSKLYFFSYECYDLDFKVFREQLITMLTNALIMLIQINHMK